MIVTHWRYAMLRLSSVFLVMLVFGTTVVATEYTFLTQGDFPAWSPDDAKIAFSEGGSIKIINADGSGDVVDLVKDGNARAPAWSPDGSMIAFTWDESGNDEIWLVKTTGGEDPFRLTDCQERRWLDSDPMSGDFPTWSPDGKLVIFWSGWGLGAPGFKTIPFDDNNPDGEKDMKILIDANSEAELSFSPDGTKIVYDGEVQENRDIWIANADGTKRQRLTNDEAEDLHPDWAPKRQFAVQIVFVSNRKTGQRDLWLTDVSGGEPILLTEEMRSGEYKYPCWSNDGTRIAFTFDNEIWIASQLPKDIIGYAVNIRDGLTTTWGKLKSIIE
jgi:Tol biopolymer transport system component